jgi:hypothetical protein
MKSNPNNPQIPLQFLTRSVMPSLLLFVSFVATPFNAHSELVYSFSQIDTGVQLTCSGILNPGGMEFGGDFYDEGRYIDVDTFSVCRIQSAQGFFSDYVTQEASWSWHFNLTPGFYSAYDSSWGDSFGLTIFAQTVVVDVPFQYAPGKPINGGMLFQGKTLASMGISPSDSFEVDLPGGDTIRGIVVVPEPTCASFSGLLFLMLAACLIRLHYRKARFD